MYFFNTDPLSTAEPSHCQIGNPFWFGELTNLHLGHLD